jgi:hypothetical protein
VGRRGAEYLQAHPHEAELRKIFDLANIEYGRIDYSLLNGKIQVWEINTNPNITSSPMKIAPGGCRRNGRSSSSWRSV